MTTPIYDSVVEETGIVLEPIYARCSSLMQFSWASRPARRTTTTAPRVGVKPVNKRKKVNR